MVRCVFDPWAKFPEWRGAGIHKPDIPENCCGKSFERFRGVSIRYGSSISGIEHDTDSKELCKCSSSNSERLQRVRVWYGCSISGYNADRTEVYGCSRNDTGSFRSCCIRHGHPESGTERTTRPQQGSCSCGFSLERQFCQVPSSIQNRRVLCNDRNT